MKPIIFSILAAVAPLAGGAAVVSYPAPTGVEINDAFTVQASDDGQRWVDVPTYKVKVDEVVETTHRQRNTSMAYFDCDSCASVRVIFHHQPVKEARIRPLSYSIEPRIDGDTLLFDVKPGHLMSVEINNDIFDNLQLFVNPIDLSAPSAKQLGELGKDKNFIYYGPGYHKVDSIVVGTDQTLYVAGGAFIDGRVVVHGVNNARIAGRGMIYPLRGNRMGIHVADSRHVSIDGVFTTQCAVGASRDVNVNNVKVMSYYGWGDGFNVFASSDVYYNNCFARTSDDCTTIYCTRKGHKGGCRNIRMENSVLWADVAHPFMIGLHGSFDPENPDSIQGAVYRNIDVLDVKEKQIDYQGVFAIVCGDNNMVKDILFDNVRVENFRKSKLIDMRICFNKKYCQAPGRGIEDVTFKDITYNGENSELSLIIGYDESRKIRNVTFDNLVINGEKITDDMANKPKWYKTGDMARIFIGEHVDNIVFK